MTNVNENELVRLIKKLFLIHEHIFYATVHNDKSKANEQLSTIESIIPLYIAYSRGAHTHHESSDEGVVMLISRYHAMQQLNLSLMGIRRFEVLDFERVSKDKLFFESKANRMISSPNEGQFESSVHQKIADHEVELRRIRMGRKNTEIPSDYESMVEYVKEIEDRIRRLDVDRFYETHRV